MRRACRRARWRCGALAACTALTLASPASAAAPTADAPPFSAAPAAPAAGAAAFGLGDAVGQALAVHPTIQAAQARLDAARFGLSAAEWARYPTLSGELSRNQDTETIRRVQLQQPLWAGGRIDADIGGGNARVAAAAAALREAELALADQIVQAAVEVRRTRLLRRLAEDSLAAYQRLLEAIERRAEGGLGLQSDVTLARSRIAQARASAAQFDADKRRADTRWRALTGQPSTELRVPETTAADAAGLDELVADAIAFSPALGRLRAEAESAGFDARSTRAALWPQLSLRAVRSWQSGTIDVKDTQYLAVVEYQPGAGLASVDRARAVYAQRDAAQAQLGAVERDLVEQVRTAYGDRQGFAARVAALDAATAANAEVIDSFLRQYNIGKRSWLDVLNAQREWTDSVQQAETTRAGALAAAYRLAVLSGRFFRP